MAASKYTRGGQPVGSGYTETSGAGPGYTVGGQAVGGYTVGGQATSHYTAPSGSHIPGARLDFQHSIQQHAALPPQHDSGLFGNLVTQTGELIGQIPNAAVQLPGTLIYTFGPRGMKEDTGIGWLDAPFHWLGVRGHGPHATSDPRSLIGQNYMPVAADVHALKKGDWHYFEQHPLNPILDVATVLSVGGVGALKVAEAGRLGEYAKTIATTERLIKSGDTEEALNQARTLQGRIRQRLYDNWRMKEGNADLPVVGANTAIKNILTRRANNDTVRMNLPVRAFQQLTAKLTPAERAAVHLLAEDVPYTDRVAVYEARRLELIAENGKRAKRLLSRPPKTRARAPKGVRNIESYLALIKDPAVRAAVEHPSPALREAVWGAYDLEKKAGNTLKDAGAITQETRDKRVQLPSEILTPPGPPPAAAAPAVPRVPTGPMHGPTRAPPWIGAPTRPPSVFPGGAPAFTVPVRVRRDFYSDYIEKGLPEGVVSRPRKPRGGTVEVTMNEAGLRHILAAAKRDGKSSARATIRKLEGQKAKIDEARAKAGRKLTWRRDAQTGSSYVPGSDYHVDPIHETGEWEAMKGNTGLGVYHELGHAKDRIERHAEDLRNAERRAELAKIEATHAGTGLPAESFTEEPGRIAPAVAELSPLEQQINELGVNLAKAERRLAQTHDPGEKMKLHSMIERGRVKANRLLEEYARSLGGAPPTVAEEAQVALARATEATDRAAAEQSAASVSEPAATLFHGTRKRFEGDTPGDIYSTGSGVKNLYGHGFYTTDSRDVASTYTRKGGATESQHVYGVHWTGEGEPKLLDLDKPAHATVKEWAEAQLREANHGHFSVTEESFDAVVKAMDSGTSGEVIRAVRHMWGSTGEVPLSEVNDLVAGLSDILHEQGYDGLKHVGGTLRGGGKKTHNVSIFFDTKKLKLSDATSPEAGVETWTPAKNSRDFAQTLRRGDRLVTHDGREGTVTKLIRDKDGKVTSVEFRPEARPEPPPMGGGSLGYIHNVHDPTGELGLPPNFRFPHTRKGVAAGDFIPQGVQRALGKNRLPSQLRHNEGVLLRDALFLTEPEQVYVSDYLSTMRWASLNNLQRRSLLPISQELRIEDVNNGYRKRGWWYFRPSFDHKTTVPVPREVRFGEGLHQDRMSLDSEYGYKKLKDRASHVVDESSFEALMTDEERVAYRKGKAEMTPDERDAYNLETMKRLGIRQVPPAFGKDFSKEFGGTSRAERLFIDKPLDVWRMITLNYRPAWAVNNFVGNALMGFARYGVPGAAWYLRVLATTERGEDKIVRLWKWTEGKPGLRNKYAEAFRTVGIHIPTRQRVFGEAFRESAPWVEQAGLYGSQSRIRHGGVYSGFGEAAIARIRDSALLRGAGLTARAVTMPLRAVSHGIVKAEILLAENTSREAAMMVELGPDFARVRETARLAGEANLSWAEALRRIDPKSVELASQRMEDFLGNFNDLSHFERRWLRKLIPFYSWFKVITKVTAKYAARYPGRVLLLKNMEQALDTSGEQNLPSWLQGSVMIGGPDRRGVQTLISTQGLNPYETLPQLATGGMGGVQNPFITAAVIAESGRDPAFGSLQDYYGLGATNRTSWGGQAERVAGAFLGGLAPVRVGQQTTEPYKGKLYSPSTYAQEGPLSVNDFLLQYLGVPIRHVNTAEARRERGLR